MDLNEVKLHLSKYLRGDEDQETFRKWLAQSLWNQQVFGTEVEGLLASLDLRFAEFVNGGVTEAELHARLSALAGSLVQRVLVENQATGYATSSSTFKMTVGSAGVVGRPQMLPEKVHA